MLRENIDTDKGRFNSSKVQLERFQEGELVVLVLGFNSSKVQLEPSPC